ncbi:putative membrane protein [Arthrobacter sp. B2I5]|uniref:hypothetical protein n=1 Tax=Arthrobacter sp. B2I5 TaxID=3042266 RepID=UPI00278721BD|nr:hypothetical protein [Arthrobacter sp. B2I5]MDQ0825541.1 putative membrane protein [Arthrobacter sp. B2I5]
MAVVDDRRATWRLASSLLLAGVVVSLVAGLLHAESHDANDHLESFTAYANSGIWTTVHLGQFVGMALVGAGLVSLATGLASWGTAPGVQLRPLGWAARFGAVSAAAAVALYAALQAVDGVALKQAVDAWAAAPEPEKAARFATAEGIRWLEWGMRSYQSILLGAALVLVGVAVAATHHVPRMIGYLMALSGLGYLAQGWIIGESGFSAGNAIPTLVSILAIVISAIWLAVSTWRMKEQTTRPSGSPESIAP